MSHLRSYSLLLVLLAIVVNSYRQTIHAYPHGGGSYIVAKDNLGKYPSLVSGASMLVDYILTVAVSVAGGVAAIVSAFNGLAPYRIWLCVGFIALITYANLRGVRGALDFLTLSHSKACGNFTLREFEFCAIESLLLPQLPDIPIDLGVIHQKCERYQFVNLR